jgi:hypothetical protein
MIGLHPEALVEIERAHGWYEDEREGLGDELLDEIGRAFDRIEAAPTLLVGVRYGRQSDRVTAQLLVGGGGQYEYPDTTTFNGTTTLVLSRTTTSRRTPQGGADPLARHRHRP